MHSSGKVFSTTLAQACSEIFCASWCRKSYQTVLSLSQSFELFTYISLYFVGCKFSLVSQTGDLNSFLKESLWDKRESELGESMHTCVTPIHKIWPICLHTHILCKSQLWDFFDFLHIGVIKLIFIIYNVNWGIIFLVYIDHSDWQIVD